MDATRFGIILKAAKQGGGSMIENRTTINNKMLLSLFYSLNNKLELVTLVTPTT